MASHGKKPAVASTPHPGIIEQSVYAYVAQTEPGQVKVGALSVIFIGQIYLTVLPLVLSSFVARSKGNWHMLEPMNIR